MFFVHSGVATKITVVRFLLPRVPRQLRRSDKKGFRCVCLCHRTAEEEEAEGRWGGREEERVEEGEAKGGREGHDRRVGAALAYK